MGASESVISNSTKVNAKQKSRMIAGITLLLGLFGPFMLTIYNYSIVSQTIIQSMLWMYVGSGSMYPYQGFSIIPPYAWTSMFPIMILRFVPVLQIYRYYQGKTTRRRAAIASVFGDGFFLSVILIMLIVNYAVGLSMGMYAIPLPFQFLFCAIMLWRYPIAEPTTPWEDMEEHQSWWEKDQEPNVEKPKSEDELWK